MGLDIYLYTKNEQAANEAHTQGWDAAYHEYYDSDGELKPGVTEEEFKAACALVPPYNGSGDRPSERYPEHFFKRNYLRSSYNESGFNRAVPDMLGREEGGLYWIFDPVIEGRDEPYETLLDSTFIAKLEFTKQRALSVASELRESDPLRATSVSVMLGGADHQWHELPSEDEALAWYREEQVRRDESKAKLLAEGKEVPEEYGYMNAKGQVFGFTKGMEVLAVTMGRNPLASFSQNFPVNTVGGQMGIMPQAVLIYRLEDEGKAFYVQGAEIIAEFCDEANDLIARDGSCMMHWSG